MFVDPLVGLAHSCATFCAKTWIALQWRNLPSLRGLYRRTPRWVFTARHTKNTSGGGQKGSAFLQVYTDIYIYNGYILIMIITIDIWWYIYIYTSYIYIYCIYIYIQIQYTLYNIVDSLFFPLFFRKFGAKLYQLDFHSHVFIDPKMLCKLRTDLQATLDVLSKCFILKLQIPWDEEMVLAEDFKSFWRRSWPIQWVLVSPNCIYTSYKAPKNYICKSTCKHLSFDFDTSLWTQPTTRQQTHIRMRHGETQRSKNHCNGDRLPIADISTSNWDISTSNWTSMVKFAFSNFKLSFFHNDLMNRFQFPLRKKWG